MSHQPDQIDEEGPSRLTVKQRWWLFHKANPHVYELFERFTFEAISRGHKSLSAWLLVNRIRWETSIVTTGGDFKVSNDYIAYYARLFMARHPSHDGFFKIKALRRT
ncbi:hypothetical protein UFOVP36_7 [uncultured Caudovirales phage]|uniref:Uncharacterized protein n=1 Tax=uncultured Caudovirales phage TaxID=2100421 RepID=A0A6J5KLV3_9CAUD|nr:hypothetical protein UFOVP36_7 [uncultured Caudovirales phage]